MNSKSKGTHTINLFDFLVLLGCFAGIYWLVQGFIPLYSVGLVVLSILIEIARLLVQKHSYRHMTATEKEIYLENRTLFSYRPEKDKKTGADR
jgi:Flp pilus assembly protein TadB